MFIVDFDDTLFDTHQFKITVNSALALCGVNADDADWSYKAARNLPDGQYAYSHARRAEFLGTRGYDAGAIARALENITSVESLRAHLLPGAIEFLQALKKIGQPMILLSLGDPNFQELKVRGSGVDAYFDRMFMVSEKKEAVIAELLAHTTSTECWLINDKVSETLLLLEKHSFLRPILKVSDRIPKQEYISSGILYFDKLKDILQYIIDASPRHESAGALVFKNSGDPQIVVMRRAEKNTLHLPKGTRESGEEIEQTVVREIKEETNVDCKILKYLISIPSTFTKDGRTREKITHYFAAEYVSGDLKSTDKEHDEVHWMPIHEAVQEFSVHGAHLEFGFEDEIKVLKKFLQK